MQLDHATIVTDDIEGTRHFFEDIVGIHTGPRPPFRVDGFWLYLNDRPAIHVTEATLAATTGLRAPRIDHIALRVDDAREWGTLVERLHRSDTYYEMAVVPLTQEIQLFVSIAPGVNIEFVAAANVMEQGEATT